MFLEVERHSTFLGVWVGAELPSVPPASWAVGAVGAPPFMGSSSASDDFPPNLPPQPPNVHLRRLCRNKVTGLQP